MGFLYTYVSAKLGIGIGMLLNTTLEGLVGDFLILFNAQYRGRFSHFQNFLHRTLYLYTIHACVIKLRDERAELICIWVTGWSSSANYSSYTFQDANFADPFKCEQKVVEGIHQLL